MEKKRKKRKTTKTFLIPGLIYYAPDSSNYVRIKISIERIRKKEGYEGNPGKSVRIPGTRGQI